MRKIILISFIFLTTIIGGMMSMPMNMMSQGVNIGVSMKNELANQTENFVVDAFTQRNYASPNIFYFYGYMMNKNKAKSYHAKFLLERSIQINKDSFIQIGGIVQYDENNPSGHIRTLYYDTDFFFNIFNIRIGRSVKIFHYDSHFEVIDFLSKINLIYNRNNIFLQGSNIDSINIKINNTSGTNYMSIYAYDDDITDDIYESKYLFEIATKGVSSKSSLFIHKSDDNLSIAIATKRNISENIYTKASLKYTKHTSNTDKLIAMSSSIDYHINNNFLVGVNYGVWEYSNKNNNKKSTIKNIIYSKFKIDTLKVKTSLINDGIQKAHISLNYKIDNMGIYLDGFVDTEDKNKHTLRFMVSYMD